MTWEQRLLDLFDDLEQQAEGLQLAERDALVLEQRRAEYAEIDLAARLHASLGNRVLLAVAGVGPVDAVLSRVGAGWCLLGSPGRQELVVVLDAVLSWRGLADRAVAAGARPLTARLGLGSALRRVAEARAEVLVHRIEGAPVRGVLGKVGKDFVELHRADADEVRTGPVEVVPFAALSALRPV